MGKVLKNKIFWGSLGHLIVLIVVILDNPSYWKTLLLINIMLSYPLPKLEQCFRGDLPSEPLPPNKGEYDYQDGKLIFK